MKQGPSRTISYHGRSAVQIKICDLHLFLSLYHFHCLSIPITFPWLLEQLVRTFCHSVVRCIEFLPCPSNKSVLLFAFRTVTGFTSFLHLPKSLMKSLLLKRHWISVRTSSILYINKKNRRFHIPPTFRSLPCLYFCTKTLLEDFRFLTSHATVCRLR